MAEQFKRPRSPYEFEVGYQEDPAKLSSLLAERAAEGWEPVLMAAESPSPETEYETGTYGGAWVILRRIYIEEGQPENVETSEDA